MGKYKIKTSWCKGPGARTAEIIDYIKPSIRRKPNFLLVHSGHRRGNGQAYKIKLGFSSIIDRGDFDKADEIVPCSC